MTVPTIEELQDLGAKRFVFAPDNTVRYWMDFAGWETLPSDRIFYLGESVKADRVVLYALGYGVAGAYGNGSVYVDPNELPAALAEEEDRNP